MSRSYLRQALTGALDCAFVALSVAIYGVVFGVLARGKGLEPLDVLAMSALVFSGTAQFIALDLWLPPLPIGALALTSLVVSLRFLLICASWIGRAHV